MLQIFKALENEKLLIDNELAEKQITYATLESESEKELLLTDIRALNTSDKKLREQTKELILKANPKS